MNPTLELLDRRSSTRVYAPTPITDAEKDAILSATFRAPTGGNMMPYTIIDVADQAIKDRLVVTCDDQPFIAKAPWVLVFVADFQKWVDLFDYCDVASLTGESARKPGVGDLMLACSDALIAAQNAVIAAESLGIGSCYIGDILENAEEHIEMFGLPPHALPVAMLCFGRAAAERPRVPRQTAHMVHTDRYKRLTESDLAGVLAELEAEYAPRGHAPGVANYVQAIYQRKYASDFMVEMNRSVGVWLERWQGR
jgi:nitroreductase